jgi:hypothetical protein
LLPQSEPNDLPGVDWFVSHGIVDDLVDEAKRRT